MSGSTGVRERGARRGPVLAGLAGPLVVALTTHEHGVNISPDALTYLAGADVLATDGIGGVVTFPTALHAPGLSTTLAPAAALGVTVEAARWLNIALVAASAAGVGVFLARRIRPVLALVAAALVGLGYPIVHAASWLTSEPLFIALSLAHLALLAGLVATRRPEAVAAGAGLVAALAVLVRYSGVSVVPIGVLAVALLAPHGRRLRSTGCYVLPVVLLVGGWLTRNVLITGFPTGDRASNELAVTDVVADAAETLTDWFVPSRGPEVVRAILLVLVVAAAVAATVAAVRGRSRVETSTGRRPVLVALLAGYVVTGAVSLTIMVSATNTDPMGDRLLSPLWPALVALLVVVADLALDRSPVRARVAGVLVLVPLLAAGFGAVRTLDAAVDGEWTGAGFNGPRWQSEAVRALVAASPPGTLIVGNEPYGLTVATGRVVAESPRYTAYASTRVSDDSVENLVRSAATTESYLVWTVVDDEIDSDHVPPPKLARHLTLVPVASTPAGQAYRVVPLP